MSQITDKTIERLMQRPAYEMAMLACEIYGVEYVKTGRTRMVSMKNPHTKWDGMTMVRCDSWHLVYRDCNGQYLTWCQPGGGFVSRMAKLYVKYITEEL